MLNDVKISIVFPIYNEEKNLDFLLKEWDDLLKKNKIIYEFVLAEDGSTDQTKNII